MSEQQEPDKYSFRLFVPDITLDDVARIEASRSSGVSPAASVAFSIATTDTAKTLLLANEDPTDPWSLRAPGSINDRDWQLIRTIEAYIMIAETFVRAENSIGGVPQRSTQFTAALQESLESEKGFTIRKMRDAARATRGLPAIDYDARDTVIRAQQDIIDDILARSLKAGMSIEDSIDLIMKACCDTFQFNDALRDACVKGAERFKVLYRLTRDFKHQI